MKQKTEAEITRELKAYAQKVASELPERLLKGDKVRHKATCRKRNRQAGIEAIEQSYNQLDGEWGLFYKVTRYFIRKVRFDDREDWLHDTMLEMAKVKAKYEPIGKPLTEAGLMRVASYQVTEYWERLRRLTTWLDCGNCSKAQRRKCREEDLYSECPKYHPLVSLNTTANSSDGGEPSEFIEFLADDKAIDIVARLDARRILRGLPKRIVQTGYKVYSGLPLTKTEQRYLNRYQQEARKKQQLALI